jgi:hypothetical protein
MKLLALLTPDRFQPGIFLVLDGVGAVVLGPVRCRGEADNAAAAGAGNPTEDPAKPYGDFPHGTYRVTDVIDVPRADQGSYGPFFFRLEPIEGEAAEVQRPGIGLHGGRPGQRGTPNWLRATYGCLRVSNGVAVTLARLVSSELVAKRMVWLQALIIDEEGAVAA